MCDDKVPSATKPEFAYRDASESERKKLRDKVIEEHRPHLARLVRRMVAPQFRADAEQEGVLAILDALEKFDPSRGAAFWTFAYLWVKDAIRGWLGRGVYWSAAPNRGLSADRVKNREATEARRVHASLHDKEKHLVSVDDPEQLVCEHEAATKLKAFLSSLPSSDVRLALSERVSEDKARHHNSLIERARRAVMGDEDDADDRGSV